MIQQRFLDSMVEKVQSEVIRFDRKCLNINMRKVFDYLDGNITVSTYNNGYEIETRNNKFYITHEEYEIMILLINKLKK